MDNQIDNDLLNFLPYDFSKIKEKSKTITYSNFNEVIDDSIEELVIWNNIDISKLNLPSSIKIINLERLKTPLLNLPVSLEKIIIQKGCQCCLDKSKIPFGCEVNLIEKQNHDFNEYAYAQNYNILRIMSGMSGLSYSN